MSEREPGGFAGDPAAAFDAASAGAGCCGTPPAGTDQAPGGCCGTSEAGAGGGCCTTEAKAEAVAAGSGCCG